MFGKLWKDGRKCSETSKCSTKIMKKKPTQFVKNTKYVAMNSKKSFSSKKKKCMKVKPSPITRNITKKSKYLKRKLSLSEDPCSEDSDPEY